MKYPSLPAPEPPPEQPAGEPTRAERVQDLELQLREVALQGQLNNLRESLGFSFGQGGSAINLVTEDPAHDDGQVWNEVGLHTGLHGHDPDAALPPQTTEDLRRGRRVSRRMAADNGYAIGALEARVSYIVGPGLNWQAVPKDPEDENKELTKQVNDTLKAFSKANGMCELEQELVRRGDRDGEYFLRAFPQTDRPLQVRAAEPEDVHDPTNMPKGLDILMGVEVGNGDVQDVVNYWIHDEKVGDSVPIAVSEDDKIPAVIHLKLNVDANHRRGWPTLWPVRENLIRARRLLRNSGNVAAIQSAIVAVRTHKYATQAQAESFLDRNRDALLTDNVTGKDTRFRGVSSGIIIDKGPGYDFETPIHSVNAANNVALVQADLREAASRLQMSESMFSADAAMTNFASALVAEGPVVRNFERLQPLHAAPLERVHWAAIHNDIARKVLPTNVPDLYDLQGTPPTLEVRDKANETQGRIALHETGALSTRTLQALEGLDHEEEERNLKQEQEPEAPAPGTPASPGGLRMAPGALPGLAPEETEALNGAQIAALQGIVLAVATGELPIESALELILAGFPQIDEATARRMLQAAADQPQPPMKPGGPNGTQAKPQEQEEALTPLQIALLG